MDHKLLTGSIFADNTYAEVLTAGHTMSKSEISTIYTRRRWNLANTNAIAAYEADLASDDRTQQRRAIRKYLKGVVRNDWSFQWPIQPFLSDMNSSVPETQESIGQESDDDSQEEWREREDWLSSSSVIIDDGQDVSISSSITETPRCSENFFEDTERFEKDKKELYLFKLRQKKLLEEEMSWNDGLRCFMARRDAWTCARVKKRQAFTGTDNKLTKYSSGESDGEIVKSDGEFQIEETIEVPVGLSLIPTENPIRKSIEPDAYDTIFFKLVMNSLTPACPINLKDLTQICVQGWKQIGEWPPPSNGSEITQSSTNIKKKKIDNLFLPNESDRTSVHTQLVNSQKDMMQRQRDLARQKGKGNDLENKRKTISSCINRVLGLGF